MGARTMRGMMKATRTRMKTVMTMQTVMWTSLQWKMQLKVQRKLQKAVSSSRSKAARQLLRKLLQKALNQRLVRLMPCSVHHSCMHSSWACSHLSVKLCKLCIPGATLCQGCSGLAHNGCEHALAAQMPSLMHCADALSGAADDSQEESNAAAPEEQLLPGPSLQGREAGKAATAAKALAKRSLPREASSAERQAKSAKRDTAIPETYDDFKVGMGGLHCCIAVCKS